MQRLTRNINGGGCKTTVNGRYCEERTSLKHQLLSNNYIISDNGDVKVENSTTVIGKYGTQNKAVKILINLLEVFV